MKLKVSLLVCALAAACGGEEGTGGNGGGNGNGSGGSICSGGQFDFMWMGGLSGNASGDCVVTIVSDGSPPVVQGEYSISSIEETGSEDEVALILRINRDTLDPIQAVFSPAADITCNQSDIFMMGDFEGTVTFMQRDADGFELAVAINFDCFDESDTNPMDPFSLVLSGTISGNSELD